MNCKLFSTNEWPRQNFSLQYQYNIKLSNELRIKKNINMGLAVDPKQILHTHFLNIVW